MIFGKFSEEKEIGRNKTEVYENMYAENNQRREKRPKKAVEFDYEWYGKCRFVLGYCK